MADFSSLFLIALLLVVAFSYAGLAREWSGWKAAFAVAGCALCVLLFLVATLLSGTVRLGDVRVALTAVEITVPQSGITIGGDPATDSVVVAPRTPGAPGMHAAALAIHPHGSSGLRMSFRRPGPDGPAGLVVIGRESSGIPLLSGADSTPLDGHRIGATDVVCIPDIQAAGGSATPVSLLSEDRILRARGRPAAWAPADNDRVYQLRDYLVWNIEDLGPERGSLQPGGRFAHLRSLFRQRNGSVEVLLLDPGAWVARGRLDCANEPAPEPAEIFLRPGDPVEVSFEAISAPHPSESRELFAEWRASNDPGRPAARLRTRRSAVFSTSQRDDDTWRLRVQFDTPEVVVLEAEDVDAAITPAHDRVTLVFAGRDEAEVAPDLAVIRLRSLGQPVLADLAERIELTGGAEVYRVGGPTNDEARHRIGDTIHLGRDASAEIRIERVEWSWPNLWGVFILSITALAVSVAATWRWRVASRSAFVVLALADFLLALRILVGVQGAVIATGAGAPAAPHATLVAAAVVPWLLASWAPQELRPSSWTWALQSLFVLATCVTILSFGILDWQSPHWFGAGILAGLALLGRWGRPRAIAGPWPGAAAALAGATRRVLDLISAHPVKFIFGALMLASIIRFFSGADFYGLNTAAPFTVVVVMLWAALLCAAARPADDGSFAARTGVLGRLALLALTLVPLAASFLSDHGYAIVMLLPLALVFSVFGAWAPFGQGSLLNRFMMLAPVVALALLVGIGGVMTATNRAESWPDRPGAADQAREQRIDLIEQALDRDRSIDRVTQFAAPDDLARQGTDQAEGLRSQAYAWRQFASQGPWGRGYLNLPEPGELRLYQFSDNLAAVHLLAPFGSLGTAVFLLALATAAMVTTQRVRAAFPGAWPPWPRAVGLVALWTFFGASLYMVLANLDLMPFTGRNVLMLSAYSPSDLIEAALLLLVAAATLGQEARR